MENARRHPRCALGALLLACLPWAAAAALSAPAPMEALVAQTQSPGGSSAAPVSSTAAAGPYWGEPRSGAWGAGVVLGYPIGITAKYWMNRYNALDAGFGDRDGADFWADYDLQAWAGPRTNSEGRLGAYLALGGEATVDGSSRFGIRALPGVNFWPRRVPVELFLEVGPVFRVAPGFDVEADGDIGVRYYFEK